MGQIVYVFLSYSYTTARGKEDIKPKKEFNPLVP